MISVHREYFIVLNCHGHVVHLSFIHIQCSKVNENNKEIEVDRTGASWKRRCF